MVIEAFACGVPVLGSDSGEIPYVIGDAGKVLPENDAGIWANGDSRSDRQRGVASRHGAAWIQRVQAYSVAAVPAVQCLLSGACGPRGALPPDSPEIISDAQRITRTLPANRPLCTQATLLTQPDSPMEPSQPVRNGPPHGGTVIAGGSVARLRLRRRYFSRDGSRSLPGATGAEIDRARVEECQTRFTVFPRSASP